MFRYLEREGPELVPSVRERPPSSYHSQIKTIRKGNLRETGESVGG